MCISLIATYRGVILVSSINIPSNAYRPVIRHLDAKAAPGKLRCVFIIVDVAVKIRHLSLIPDGGVAGKDDALSPFRRIFFRLLMQTYNLVLTNVKASAVIPKDDIDTDVL
jgi:hypothetical protein